VWSCVKERKQEKVDDTPTFSCLYTEPQMYCYLRGFSRFSDDTPTFSCFLTFTQDHTDVLLFIRGFYRFSDDTPTFSCFLAFTQDHTDVLLFNTLKRENPLLNNITSVWSCEKARKRRRIITETGKSSTK
jgi:hypothetical protein